MSKRPTENSNNQETQKKELETVWHLYTNFGIKGGGQTTIAFFEDDDQGLDFLEEFFYDIESRAHFQDNKNSPDNSFYQLEFTAKEAIDTGFLDMYKLQYWGKPGTIYVLFMEEIPFNKQLIARVPEDDDDE